MEVLEFLRCAVLGQPDSHRHPRLPAGARGRARRHLRDLALAQIAALGATVAILVGMNPHGGTSYWISLGFTFLGAAIFALARTRRGHIPRKPSSASPMPWLRPPLSWS